MKKLLYLSAVGLVLAGMAACSDEPSNPGDFDLKSELKVMSMKSITTGAEYPLTVARTIDTTYHYYYEVYDTLKDAAGEPVLDNNGKLQITTEEKFYLSKITAKFVEYEPVTFPSYEGVEYDTIAVALESNANWLAPMGDPVNWYSNVNSSTTGGGDADFTFAIKQFGNQLSKWVVTQDVFTRDSTLMYRFTFLHTGLKYTE